MLPHLPDLFQLPLTPSTSMHSQMQVLALALPSLSKVDGEPGTSSLDGKPSKALVTLAGLKPLALSSSSGPLPSLQALVDALKCSVIIKELLKDGGIPGVEVSLPIVSSGISTPSLSSLITPSPSLLLMFPANLILPTPFQSSLPSCQALVSALPYSPTEICGGPPFSILLTLPV